MKGQESRRPGVGGLFPLESFADAKLVAENRLHGASETKVGVQMSPKMITRVNHLPI